MYQQMLNCLRMIRYIGEECKELMYRSTTRKSRAVKPGDVFTKQ